ncbi:response regulator [Treponema pectinovorum]|uniref:response regulator n=1 Tax=Treponema pectinovorum TaxID=164 RepID=UPI0011CB3627|nr:response regulator [Treponema pectinovorum]
MAIQKKQVLIIDASPLFREFLREKLTEENIDVETAQGHRDAFIKLSSNLPDLVILDIESSSSFIQDFLERKLSNPNTVHIPIIISGPAMEKNSVANLVKYGVIKYFSKPIKFDIFFESIGAVLRSSFSLDTTPCVLEIHLNKNIIFVEIAQGMNREKIALLKYKLSELMDKNRLDSPKIIIMMTDLSLSFVDGANLELLLDNILADSRIERKNVKVLSLDAFAKDLIDGHPEYEGIEVVTDLAQVLNSVVESGATSSIQDLISDQILTQTSDSNEGSVEMRFFSDSGVPDNEEEANASVFNVAIVDDDEVVRQLLQAAFKNVNANCELFSSGTEFLKAANSKTYSLLILDIFMPGISGYDILKTLRFHQINTPVLIYSQVMQREAIIQALNLGARTYLIKPQKPDVIIRKSLEIINGR